MQHIAYQHLTYIVVLCKVKGQPVDNIYKDKTTIIILVICCRQSLTAVSSEEKFLKCVTRIRSLNATS
jgi:hypothetical protein